MVLSRLRKVTNKWILAICGPTLYDFYNEKYEMNIFESIGTRGCGIMYILYRIGLTFLPITLYFFGNNSLTYLRHFLMVYVISFTSRSVGRLLNSDYMKMINLLQKHNEDPLDKIKLNKLFSKYNISLSAVNGLQLNYPKELPYVDEYNITNENIFTITLGSLAIHSFGRRLVFPGSVSLLKYLMRPQVVEERKNIIYKIGGERIPIETRNGNVIDVLFVDKRNKGSLGKFLIIISDGNAGYCERGLSQPWIDAGYSTLAYNAPGIGESSGTPYYDQLCDGAEGVMTLAKKLGFCPEDICLYGWSIGGFATSWMAANYAVKGVVLDATFDTLLPLTENVVGTFAPEIVRFAIGYYFNMNVSKLITKYNGPTTFIRRRYDEVIITDRIQESHKSNRINALFKDFLSNRYHFLNWTSIDDIVVDEWLDADEEQRRNWFNDDGLEGDLHEYIPRDIETALELDSQTRTMIIRRICLWHFIDLETTHNTILPNIRCVLPEDLFPPGTILPSLN